jgi:hypothetical protein
VACENNHRSFFFWIHHGGGGGDTQKCAVQHKDANLCAACGELENQPRCWCAVEVNSVEDCVEDGAEDESTSKRAAPRRSTELMTMAAHTSATSTPYHVRRAA